MSPHAGRALGALALFVLAGPAIGAVTFGILATVATYFVEPDVGLTFLFASLIFMPLAYVIGGIQAVFVGTLTAIAIWRTGRAPLWLPVAAAAVSATFHIARAHEDVGVSAILLAVHVIAAACCWLILRAALGRAGA